MKLWHLIVVMGVILVLVAWFRPSARDRKARSEGEKPVGRPPLTEREQAMYFRLREALPDHIVLAQVAFSAFMTASTTAARNMFDRKVADFVICTKAFEVVAIIELDDASHRGKERADDRRDRLVQSAGHRVVRFMNLPTAERARVAILPPSAAASAPATLMRGSGRPTSSL